MGADYADWIGFMRYAEPHRFGETPDQRDVIQEMDGIADLIKFIRRDFEPAVAEKILGKNFTEF